MAYSAFERPKLHDVKSLKLYPENHDHHVSFRHKKLPPDFDLTIDKPTKKNSSYKCPIYVHDFQPQGDFLPKKDKTRKKPSHRSVLEKLEEKYWANWKPDKKIQEKTEIKIIKSEPAERRRKVKVAYNSPMPTGYKLLRNTSVSQEIQTDELPKKEEAIQSEEVVIKVEELEVNPCEIGHDTKFIKHTDSLILNYKKKKHPEERFEQPKCIRLYKNAGKTSKSYVRGGSYPLKSCLKKENGKGKLNRPGSPIIVSSYNKSRSNRR